MTVEVRCYTDPACTWSWGTEPKLRKLAWEFDGQLHRRWVMGGLARAYGSAYRDDEGRIGSGSDCFSDLMAHWLDAAAETRMPADPRIWTRNPISSSYPACIGAKAAAEQGDEAVSRYLRRVRVGLMVERRKLDHPEALIAAAGEAGLDIDRFRIDIASNAILEAFAADLEEVRTIPDEVRELGMVRHTEGHERIPFPSLVFIGADGVRHGVWGWMPYEDYRDAAEAAGASVVNSGPLPPLAAIERFGPCATVEVEVLSGRPAPVVGAELWTAAREWRLKPVRVLTGTIWEPAD